MTNQISIYGVSIRQDAQGRFCLNDLHKASGGKDRDMPSHWSCSKATQLLIEELSVKYNDPFVSHCGGNKDHMGTFACKELMYSYALWLDYSLLFKLIDAMQPDNLIKHFLENLDLEELPPDLFVYVAQEEFSHRYKVGISKHPEERIKQLNVGNPEHLVLVTYYKATLPKFQSEVQAHKVLADHRLRSEWFDKDTDINLIASVV